MLGAGAYVQRGDKKQLVGDFPQVMHRLLAEVEKSMSLQRYKGLGRDEPRAALGNHHGPGAVAELQIDDGIAADEIFIKLMGDDVEPRRAFIEANALGVRNLDV